MNSVFCKARKISKSLKGNRGSVVRYSQYLDRTLDKVDFSDKGKLLASGMNGTEERPLDFWRKAEERELQTKRKDTARFAKEYIVGLPHNLPIEEMKKVSQEIADELSKNGRAVSWYLHEPDKDENEISKNFHTHFLMSEREYQNGIFADVKNREWNKASTLQEHKRTIGEKINAHLRALNLPEWKIELTEEEKQESQQKRGEEVKATQRRRKKEVAKCDRKIKLAEVKLNGLGRTERQPTDINRADETETRKPGTNEPGYSAGTEKAPNIFEEYRQHRADERAKELERIRVQNARRIAEEQQRKLEKNRNGLQRADKDDFSIGR